MIDTASEPGSYADALRFPPWIADDRDGCLFRNLPAMAFKRRFDAGEGSNHAAPLAHFLSHHDGGDTL